MRKRLEILLYILGSLIFGLTAYFKLFLMLFTGNVDVSKRIALQFDDTFNVSLNGKPDMKFSSRCYVEASLGNKKYIIIMNILDCLFELLGDGKEHCKVSYLNESYHFKS